MKKEARTKKGFTPKIVVGLVCLAVIIAAVYFLNQQGQIRAGGVKVYFLKDEKLAPVYRPARIATRSVAGGPQNGSVINTIIQALNQGPTPMEEAGGYYSEIPKDAKILSAIQKNGIATVDFNSSLENYGGGATRVQGLIGQIVYSFTEATGAEKIKITVEGKEEVVLGGEGYVIDKPLSRSDVSF